MRKYRYRYHDKKMTKLEKFQWLLTAVIFGIVFVVYFSYRFATNCIFEWPIRWDVRACWHEQIAPAKEKAAEQAANFVPQLKAVNETQTETGVLCIICIIHKNTLETETPRIESRRGGIISLRCLATQVQDRDSQQKTEFYVGRRKCGDTSVLESKPD